MFRVVSFLLYFLTLPLLITVSGFAQDNLFKVFGKPSTTISFKIPANIHVEGNIYLISSINKDFIENKTLDTAFLKNYTYLFFLKKEGTSTITIDKIDTSGGHKNFITINVLCTLEDIKVELEKVEYTTDINAPKGETLVENIVPVLPPLTKEQIDHEKKIEQISKLEYDKLYDDFFKDKFIVNQEGYVNELDRFIESAPSFQMKVRGQLLKVKYLEKNEKLEDAFALLKEINDQEKFANIDPKSKDINEEDLVLKQSVYYEFYRAFLKEKDPVKANDYLAKAVSITPKDNPLYPYLLFRVAHKNTEDKKYSVAFEQLRYLYNTISEIRGQIFQEEDEEEYILQGEDKKKVGIHYKNFQDLDTKEQEIIQEIMNQNILFGDQLLFDYAELHERLENKRDFHKAQTLYELILSKYPDSPLSQLVRMKLFYLRNNFTKPR